jgi:hypothetical protein
MVTDIDALAERLKDPEGTFTSEEAQALIDWSVNNALKGDYQTQRVQDALSQSAAVSAYAASAMDRLEALWDSSPMVPTLQVVSEDV